MSNELSDVKSSSEFWWRNESDLALKNCPYKFIFGWRFETKKSKKKPSQIRPEIGLVFTGNIHQKWAHGPVPGPSPRWQCPDGVMRTVPTDPTLLQWVLVATGGVCRTTEDSIGGYGLSDRSGLPARAPGKLALNVKKFPKKIENIKHWWRQGELMSSIICRYFSFFNPSLKLGEEAWENNFKNNFEQWKFSSTVRPHSHQ